MCVFEVDVKAFGLKKIGFGQESDTEVTDDSCLSCFDGVDSECVKW